MIYIQKQIGFWNIDSIPDSYLIGTTLSEYDSGAYLPLSAQQIAFHEAHPEATQMEVYAMQLTPAPEHPVPDPAPVPDQLAEARRQKLQEIEAQDAFSNKFFVSITKGGVEVANQEMWVDRDTRNSLLNNTLPALQGDGEIKTKLWTTTTPPVYLEVPISWAVKNLPLVEIYAKRTYDLRDSNEAATYTATSVEQLALIDVKANYPHFLTFELNLDLGV